LIAAHFAKLAKESLCETDWSQSVLICDVIRFSEGVEDSRREKVILGYAEVVCEGEDLLCPILDVDSIRRSHEECSASSLRYLLKYGEETNS
jgi:hypothetical protein